MSGNMAAFQSATKLPLLGPSVSERRRDLWEAACCFPSCGRADVNSGCQLRLPTQQFQDLDMSQCELPLRACVCARASPRLYCAFDKMRSILFHWFAVLHKLFLPTSKLVSLQAAAGRWHTNTGCSPIHHKSHPRCLERGSVWECEPA